MNFDLLLDKLTNPALLCIFMGIIAMRLKGDLEILPNTSKFSSRGLFFSIGFKGGQELSHNSLDLDILWSMLLGMPIYLYLIQSI